MSHLCGSGIESREGIGMASRFVGILENNISLSGIMRSLWHWGRRRLCTRGYGLEFASRCFEKAKVNWWR